MATDRPHPDFAHGVAALVWCLGDGERGGGNVAEDLDGALLAKQSRGDDPDSGDGVLRDPVDVRLAWLPVHLTRLGGAVEEDGYLGLPVGVRSWSSGTWDSPRRRAYVSAAGARQQRPTRSLIPASPAQSEGYRGRQRVH